MPLLNTPRRRSCFRKRAPKKAGEKTVQINIKVCNMLFLALITSLDVAALIG